MTTASHQTGWRRRRCGEIGATEVTSSTRRSAGRRMKCQQRLDGRRDVDVGGVHGQAPAVGLGNPVVHEHADQLPHEQRAATRRGGQPAQQFLRVIGRRPAPVRPTRCRAGLRPRSRTASVDRAADSRSGRPTGRASAIIRTGAPRTHSARCSMKSSAGSSPTDVVEDQHQYHPRRVIPPRIAAPRTSRPNPGRPRHAGQVAQHTISFGGCRRGSPFRGRGDATITIGSQRRAALHCKRER